MKSECAERTEWKRVIASAVEHQRALKRAHRQAWRAARDAPDARCRETARELSRGAMRVRALLLAHAWSRGRPVWTQERRARVRHEALLNAVAQVARRSATEVRAWIEQAVPEVDRAAHEAHLDRVRARALARRAARHVVRESTS